jgi:hypothetical protein
MNETVRHRWTIGATAVSAIVILPLCGVLAAGGSIEPYLEFPPRTKAVVHAAFSWPAFIALTLCTMAALAPFVCRVSQARITSDASRAMPHASRAQSVAPPLGLRERRRFPWWGWAGLAWTALAWTLAWNRWEWVGEWQFHTFTPLWLGYIAVMNALTVSRTGTSVMRRYPGYFLLLFPLSAAFWWAFEYLNRFVQNWHYLGGREFTSGEYLLLATIPFSTVLPAVISTADWLSTYPRVTAGLERAWTTRIAQSKQAGWTILLGAAGGLIGIGLWPDYLFPLVWVAPLLLIVGLQLGMGDETVFSPATRGDWRLLWVATMASLICGLFWELWNSHSLAHWEYTIPFTHRFQLFEMPLLGYAGYLPFGLECLVVVHLFIPADWICLPAHNESSAQLDVHGHSVFERCLGEPS